MTFSWRHRDKEMHDDDEGHDFQLLMAAEKSCQEIHDDDGNINDVGGDDFQLMTAEKKARQEMEDMRQQLKKMQEAERRDRRKLAEDEALRKIKKMEETITELQKSLASQKQVRIPKYFILNSKKPGLSETG